MKISILPKSTNRPATPEDLNVSVKPAEIGIEIIMDGIILEENLSRIGRNTKWIENSLKEQGYKNTKDIFLAIYYRDQDKLTIYPNCIH